MEHGDATKARGSRTRGRLLNTASGLDAGKLLLDGGEVDDGSGTASGADGLLVGHGGFLVFLCLEAAEQG